MTTQQQLLTPVGRIIGGSLYTPQDKDADGNPLMIKNGPNAGKPTVRYSFGVAIPKTPGKHWWDETWGRTIWSVGSAAFPQACQSRNFSWKVKDGDSTEPNTKGRRPCDQEGHPGHWVLWFASTYPPKVYKDNGNTLLTQVDAVKPGYYVQVQGTVDDNGSQQKPGVYLNHNMVCLVGYGTEIVSGPDATAVGFGVGVQLPPGASATPLPGSFGAAGPAGAAPMPGMPAQPGGVPFGPGAMPPMGSSPPVMPPVGPAAAAPQMPPMVVQPHPGFLQGPPQMPAPPAPVRTMTPKAQGYSYEQLIAQGWTDQVLIQQGLMLA